MAIRTSAKRVGSESARSATIRVAVCGVGRFDSGQMIEQRGEAIGAAPFANAGHRDAVSTGQRCGREEIVPRQHDIDKPGHARSGSTGITSDFHSGILTRAEVSGFGKRGLQVEVAGWFRHRM